MTHTFELEPDMGPETASLLGLRGMQISATVSSVRDAYWVNLYVLPGSDEMWERLTLCWGFPTHERANEMIDRIFAKRCIDLNYWIWEPSRCSPFAAFQQRPTAVFTALES